MSLSASPAVPTATALSPACNQGRQPGDLLAKCTVNGRMEKGHRTGDADELLASPGLEITRKCCWGGSAVARLAQRARHS